jgi:hypothetical protein
MTLLEPNMKPIGLFYTPSSMEEMQDILESLPARERALVYPYVMQMYNLLVTQVPLKCAAIADAEDIYQTYNTGGAIMAAFGLNTPTKE